MCIRDSDDDARPEPGDVAVDVHPFEVDGDGDGARDAHVVARHEPVSYTHLAGDDGRADRRHHRAGHRACGHQGRQQGLLSLIHI